MKRFVFLVLLLSTWVFGQTSAPRKVTDEEVRRVHQSMLIIDTHSDTTSRTVAGEYDLSQRLTSGHMDIPRMREGGLGAQFWAVYVGANYTRDNHSANRALQMIDTTL